MCYCAGICVQSDILEQAQSLLAFVRNLAHLVECSLLDVEPQMVNKRNAAYYVPGALPVYLS